MNSVCEFRLKSSKNRIALVFDDFYTGYYDQVFVYDGNGATVEQYVILLSENHFVSSD